MPNSKNDDGRGQVKNPETDGRLKENQSGSKGGNSSGSRSGGSRSSGRGGSR